MGSIIGSSLGTGSSHGSYLDGLGGALMIGLAGFAPFIGMLLLYILKSSIPIQQRNLILYTQGGICCIILMIYFLLFFKLFRG